MIRTENYKIVPCNSYFTVYYQGNFYCSSDTKKEAEQEIYNHEHNEQNTNKRKGEQNTMSEWNGILLESELAEQIEKVTAYEQPSELNYTPFFS